MFKWFCTIFSLGAPDIFRQGSRNLKKQSVFRAIAVVNKLYVDIQPEKRKPTVFFF